MHQHADQILARSRNAIVEHLAHVGEVVGRGVQDLLRDVLRAIRAGDHVVRPSLQTQAVFFLHAEQIRDHRGRKRCGQVVHDVAAAGLFERIDQLRHDRTDPLFVRSDAAHREALIDEVPLADVHRVVAVDHRRLRSSERPAAARR